MFCYVELGCEVVLSDARSTVTYAHWGAAVGPRAVLAELGGGIDAEFCGLAFFFSMMLRSHGLLLLLM